jgi:hypothetical protein
VVMAVVLVVLLLLLLLLLLLRVKAYFRYMLRFCETAHRHVLEARGLVTLTTVGTSYLTHYWINFVSCNCYCFNSCVNERIDTDFPSSFCLVATPPPSLVRASHPLICLRLQVLSLLFCPCACTSLDGVRRSTLTPVSHWRFFCSLSCSRARRICLPGCVR